MSLYYFRDQGSAARPGMTPFDHLTGYSPNLPASFTPQAEAQHKRFTTQMMDLDFDPARSYTSPLAPSPKIPIPSPSSAPTLTIIE